MNSEINVAALLVLFWRGSLQQVNEHFVELFRVQVYLYFDWLHSSFGLSWSVQVRIFPYPAPRSRSTSIKRVSFFVIRLGSSHAAAVSSSQR